MRCRGHHGNDRGKGQVGLDGSICFGDVFVTDIKENESGKE